jgi:hypothetical protein
MANKQEFERAWQVLVMAYPNWVKDLGPGQLEGTFQVYEHLLADIPAPVLEAAVKQHIAANKWFPAISELRTLALALTAQPHGTAMEAWGKVVDAFTRGDLKPNGDGYLQPEWDDPVCAKVVNAIGWYELCHSTNQEADRAHFMRAYDTLVQREQADQLLLPQVRELAARLAAERPKELTG